MSTHHTPLPTPTRATLGAALAITTLAACQAKTDDRAAKAADSAAAPVAAAPAATKVGTVEGFKTPESVRYDADQDVYFVSNINGNPSAKDGNGFIARVKAGDATVDSMMFIAGGRGGVTLNAPKGMAIQGDTLWVADIDAVRGFNRRTGKLVASVDFGRMKAMFLNDVAVGGDGAIYITDTGVRIGNPDADKQPRGDKVFRLAGRTATVAVRGEALAKPNGIAWDAGSKRFIIGPFGSPSLMTWVPADSAPAVLASGPGQYDGVEVLPDGRLLVTSWADSSVWSYRGTTPTRLISGVNAPADIGIDTRRRRVAVPLFLDNRVELYEIP